jgi:hypothetical protein
LPSPEAGFTVHQAALLVAVQLLLLVIAIGYVSPVAVAVIADLSIVSVGILPDCVIFTFWVKAPAVSVTVAERLSNPVFLDTAIVSVPEFSPEAGFTVHQTAELVAVHTGLLDTATENVVSAAVAAISDLLISNTAVLPDCVIFTFWVKAPAVSVTVA